MDDMDDFNLRVKEEKNVNKKKRDATEKRQVYISRQVRN